MGQKATWHNAKYPPTKQKDYISSAPHLSEKSLHHLSILFGLLHWCIFRVFAIKSMFLITIKCILWAIIQMSTRKAHNNVKNAFKNAIRQIINGLLNQDSIFLTKMTFLFP